MTVALKPLPCKMYTYFSRRRALLFKGCLLLGTVWLTVAVLILMENRERTTLEPDKQHQRHYSFLYDPQNEQPQPQQQQEAQENNQNSAEEEDPLSLASYEEGSLPLQSEELNVRKGIKLYGELGKPVVLPSNLSAEVQKLVNEGWQKNAFNQYVSDLISLHRTLPDPRDEW